MEIVYGDCPWRLFRVCPRLTVHRDSPQTAVTPTETGWTGRERGELFAVSGVALTFEKLRIANTQHGKNCVSSPAAKATISTDLPKIDKHENTNV